MNTLRRNTVRRPAVVTDERTPRRCATGPGRGTQRRQQDADLVAAYVLRLYLRWNAPRNRHGAVWP